MHEPVALRLPLDGPCLVQNSPARRVPSHGTHVMATTYAIDLMPVDDRGRSAVERDWRTVLATEPPERFWGFGAPVLSPASGTVVHVHDGEPDHPARRSPLSLVPYGWGQAARLRRGADGLAGNHVVLRLRHGRGFVALAHLQHGSVGVTHGDLVEVGRRLGACGNSGNSTEPHVHLQAMDGADAMTAHGLPIVLTRFREHRGGTSRLVASGLPAEASVVEPSG
ncbi:M23 family metallopeptidase [Solicola sp. PLA-1-18]|uniref:M23 family metallopeptidase n=1 Tax=Solicola sp. PLA-1-18 TaxID=3380532 RepID=UPI003B7F13D6